MNRPKATALPYKITLLALIACGSCFIRAGWAIGNEGARQSKPGETPPAGSGSLAEVAGTNVAQGAIQQKVLAFNLEGYSEKGAKQWEITGESAEAVEANKIRLNNIVARTFGEEAEATLSAEEGLYDKTKNNVLLEKNVKVVVTNTDKLAAKYGDMSLMNFSGGNPSKETAQGPAVSGDPPQEHSSAKGLTTITCDGEVEFNYQENRAHFAKNVRVVNDDGEIAADKIIIFMDIKSKKIKEIVADGNVVITQGENKTYSEKATYNETEKKITLSGRPKLVFYQQGGITGQFMGPESTEGKR